ncbi:MAG: peptide ABC transporter substrate-binding protein [Thermoflexales bacterium]|nr:peptide ABC transporter substrate-binding protein [Thermoflexales bacterium]
MSRKNFWSLVSLVIIASMLMTACQPETQTIVQTVVVKEPGTEKEVIKEVIVTTTPVPVAPPAPTAKPQRPNIIRANFGYGDVPTLDPSISEDTSSITVIEESFVALTRLDEVTSELNPGMATKWDISQDGKIYTFHLRNDVPWVRWDGTKVVKAQDCDGNDRLVTAKDFEYGILRALKPETASPYAYVLAFAIDGASAFNNGETDDPTTVGVKALDDWTLEVKFLEDAAYNANIIGLWTAMPVPKWVIEGDCDVEGRGDRWTEPGFFQSYGPFTLKEWIHDSTLTIIKNPFWPGDEATPQAKVDEVIFSMLDETAAMAEYEAGNMDATAVPSADIDRVKSDPTLSKQLVIAPNLCTYFYGFNTTAPYVDDARVRRALSLAVDRQGLVDNVLKGGQQPAQWFSRPGLAAVPTMDSHPDLGVSFKPEEANKWLDEYLAEKGLTKADLDITVMFNTSSGHQKIAEALQQMWKTTLGLDIKLTNQEWAVFLDTIKGKDTPQIWRLGWCLDYPDANNFIREVCAANGSSNPYENGEPAGGFMWKNEKFEELVKQAAVEKDPAKRVEMYAQAEQILVYEDAVMIPLYWYTRVTLTQPWIKRTFSAGGHERYENWEVLQD